VRLRSITLLSLAAASALLLSGCAGTGDGDASASPAATDAAAVDLCDAQAATGDAAESVVVDGEPGQTSTLSFDAPLDVDELEVATVNEGDGAQVAAGDFISYSLTAYSAETGELIGQYGFEEGEMFPVQISAETTYGQVFGCGHEGDRVVAVFPATEDYDGEVYVLDLLSIVPTAAWGEQQDPVEGLPTVSLAEDGTPTIDVPDTDAPTETTVTTLKKGDGYEVQSGDYVLIQYRGARWSTGELFDGGDTWADGTPYSAQTTGFVPGFQQALEGQTVGSQVLVVITPEDGYGEGEINEDDLVGETLVFVIDIIGAQHVESE